MDSQPQQYTHPYDSRRSSAPANYAVASQSIPHQGFAMPGQPASRTQWSPQTFAGPSYNFGSPGVEGTGNFDLDVSYDAKAIDDTDISKFTKDSNTGPWDGARFASTNLTWPGIQHFPALLTGQHDHYSAKDDADSGYRSQPSKLTGSIYTPQVREQRLSAGTKGRGSRASSNQDASEVVSQTGTNAGKRKSSTQFLPCPDCGKVPASKSEQTKHAKTHTRPWKCSVRDCPDFIRGFGTTNDKDRHEMCKHDIYKPGVRYFGFVCSACPAHTTGKEKWWPRRDNFKAHLRRKHPGPDIEAIIESSRREKLPDDNMTIVSAGQTIQLARSQADSQMYQDADDIYHPTQHYLQPPNLSRQPTQQGEMLHWPQHTDLNANPLAEIGMGIQDMTTALQGFNASNTQDQYNMITPTMTTAATPMPAMSSMVHASSQQQPGIQYRQSIDPFRNSLGDEDGGMIDDYSSSGTHKRRKTEGDEMQPYVDEMQSYGDEEVVEHCKYCGKSSDSLRRPCDMRKHLSRHRRRYGCTEPRCYDKHGSKSDWFRHENRVHKLPEAWLCRLDNGEGQYCNEYFRYDGPFRHHLTTKHGYKDDDNMTTTVDDMHLPKDGRTRFWCGFCRDIIHNDDQLNPWNTRCLHVGKHMDIGGGMSIQEWLCPEAQKTKSTITEQDKIDIKARAESHFADMY